MSASLRLFPMYTAASAWCYPS